MAELPTAYRKVSEEDQKKGKTFFERGKTVAQTGNFDYAIEMYLEGLRKDPEEVAQHQALRDVSLRRKATGGKALGMMEASKLKGHKDEITSLTNWEKLLAYDPGNTDHMQGMLQAAIKAGCFDTALWLGPIFLQAISSEKKPEVKKYMVLKDVYRSLQRFTLAAEVMAYVVRAKPDDRDLQTEYKHLKAEEAIQVGNYQTAKSFRESVRDQDKQTRLLESEKDVHSEDILTRGIREAEAEWKAEPNETGKIMKLVEALVKTEDADNESRAMHLLDEAYKRTQSFRFRLRQGQIELGQMTRMERSLAQQIRDNPADAELKQMLEEIQADKLARELSEFKLWADAYPTDLTYKFELAVRMFRKGEFTEAIPLLQQSRLDPKLRTDSSLFLGQAFLDAGFSDEAVDTLAEVIDGYAARGDAKSKDMYYWYGRALEAKGTKDLAIKSYSQLAQWDFNFRDVQVRIKRLRSGG